MSCNHQIAPISNSTGCYVDLLLGPLCFVLHLSMRTVEYSSNGRGIFPFGKLNCI